MALNSRVASIETMSTPGHFDVVPTTLYRFYDAGNLLLYVGITSVGPNRWGSHEGREWWSQVERISAEHYPNRELAAMAEIAAIRREKPLYNLVHSTTRTPAKPRVYRAHGQGSITHRQDGRWQVAFMLGGKRRFWYARTLPDAELILAALVGQSASRGAKAKAIAILGAEPA